MFSEYNGSFIAFPYHVGYYLHDTIDLLLILCLVAASPVDCFRSRSCIYPASSYRSSMWFACRKLCRFAVAPVQESSFPFLLLSMFGPKTFVLLSSDNGSRLHI